MRLEKVIGEYLRERKWTLSIAESCTGGLICDRITNVSGSSDYFEGGMVTYSNESKAEHLGIPLNYLKRYGAVSSQVARKMAQRVRKAFNTTFGLSITGVAGPTGGTKKTPVGRVYIGIANDRRTWVRKEDLRGSRRDIKKQVAERSLQFFYEILVHSTRISDWIKNLSRSKESAIVLIRKAPQGISNRGGHLGIFPASFNPPTKAHLALIKEAKKQVDLDEILVLLDIQAMDKKVIGATFEDRMIMLKALFGRDPRISIGLSNRGLFIEKLKPLRDLYPSPIKFFFIVGFDTLIRILEKKYYRNRIRSFTHLFGESRFLVANREGREREAFERLFKQRGNKKYRDRVSFFTLPKRFSSLSSSLVQKKISERQPVNDLVPISVLRFIEKTGLYTSTHPSPLVGEGEGGGVNCE